MDFARFLEKVLPNLFDDLWNKAVVNIISFKNGVGLSAKQQIEETKAALRGLGLDDNVETY